MAEQTTLGFTASQWGNFGAATSIGGIAVQAAGAYYAAKSQQYQLRSQALDLEFQATIAGLNARAAEGDAQSALEAGKREAGRIGLQYRQVKEAARTRTAAGGIQAGVGSAAEEQASIAYAKEADQITISSNAVRAANASRMAAVGQRNNQRMAMVGARNARRAAGSISPWLAAGSSLIGGAGDVSSRWAQDARWSARYSGPRT